MNTWTSRLGLALVLTLLGWAAQPHTVNAATAFTYQGQLQLSGSPVNDTCSMQFRLYNQVTGGTLVGTIGPQAVLITGGVFTTLLDFGAGALGTGDRWLEISVDCGTGLTLLQPRQPLTAAPYAYFADTIASGAIGPLQLQESSVSSDKIVDNTIDTADIENGTITFSDVDVNSVQRRVTGICAPNTAMSAIGSDGTVTCASAGGDITAVTAGSGLTGGGTVGAVSLSASFGGNGNATSAERSQPLWPRVVGIVGDGGPSRDQFQRRGGRRDRRQWDERERNRSAWLYCGLERPGCPRRLRRGERRQWHRRQRPDERRRWYRGFRSRWHGKPR